MRERTFTEQARRTQLIDVTIELVAEHGYPATSLARIAESAGITKAAVLYHFPSKNALVESAYAHVLTGLVTAVGTAVAAAAPVDGPAAYVRSMVGHLREHPRHVRMIIEAMINVVPEAASADRWTAVADLLDQARAARGVKGPFDRRTAALVIGGGIDAIVAESLTDPAYDTAAAADVLVTAIERAWLI
ncbi:TetR/AcrR family transcriptional regulator [Kribbella yunnanensis]|uniref:TetR/AcrR family transcriptional regulator n=1 Tax=Kribbella yunnanensis TaxID=190194 RepID=A0ABN2I6S4_9ACTN